MLTCSTPLSHSNEPKTLFPFSRDNFGKSNDILDSSKSVSNQLNSSETLNRKYLLRELEKQKKRMTETKLECNQNRNPQDNDVNFNLKRKRKYSNLSSKTRLQRKRSKLDEVSQIQIRYKSKEQHEVAHSKLDKTAEDKW